MISIHNLRRSYGDFQLDVSFESPGDGILCLLGLSGSGKTSTLRLIAGFEAPDAGEILIDGVDIGGLAPAKRQLGFVFQDYALFPHLSVVENVAYGLRARSMDRAERLAESEKLLDLVGLGGFSGRRVASLSGGEQQRVALARALAPKPKALLLDEPFSAIDPERREDLGRYLVDLQRELRIPMIFVTHSRSEAMAIGTRIVLLNDGRVVEQGSPQELYSRPRFAYTARFLGRANIFSRTQWQSAGFDPGPGPGEDLLLVRPEDLILSEGRTWSIRLSTFAPPGWTYEIERRGLRLWGRSELPLTAADARIPLSGFHALASEQSTAE